MVINFNRGSRVVNTSCVSCMHYFYYVLVVNTTLVLDVAICVPYS